MALSVPLSRFTSRVGGGSAFFVRPYRVMQEIIKRLLTDLHADYFKPSGFTKERQRFWREIDSVMQEVDFQSSQWNSADSPITFYVKISVGFTDIPMRDGKPALTGAGRIGGLVSDAPAQFDLTPISYDSIRSQLLVFLPQAFSELPKHYDDIRTRAKVGWHTPIPLPETWRA